MKQITAELRRAIYEAIMRFPDVYGRFSDGSSYDELNKVDFLKLVWDLPAMPSEDFRFSNAEGDAFQHLVNNDDWDDDYTFLKRFNLLAGDSRFFIKFLEAVVSPAVRRNQKEQEEYVRSINTLLEPIDAELIAVDYVQELSVYRYAVGVDRQKAIPLDRKANTFKVFTMLFPSEYPCFTLSRDSWDDFGYKTKFGLYYRLSPEESRFVGYVKILHNDELNTHLVIPEEFTQLSEKFVSLGQSFLYYTNLKDILGPSYLDFLYALRDVAFFSAFFEGVGNCFGFKKSLIRFSEADKTFQFAKKVLAGYDYKDPINFIFETTLPYHNDPLSIRFNFGDVYDNHNLSRILAIIGKNGVGKTTVLSKLADALVHERKDCFKPNYPVFSKILATSYSIFDIFFRSVRSSFNYQYCGIQKSEGGIMDEKAISERRLKSLNLIIDFDREFALQSVLVELLGSEFVSSLSESGRRVDIDKLLSRFTLLSSGQSMLLTMAIEILAHIRLNTLLLIDEPEIHLHPKAITKMIRIINDICKEYSSCCLMATHSSIIVQELLSKNVIILDRETDGSPVVRPMRMESMGESLTAITDEIFGRSEEPSLYMDQMHSLASFYNYEMDRILRAIQNNGVPVNIQLRIMLEKICRHG